MDRLRRLMDARSLVLVPCVLIIGSLSLTASAAARVASPNGSPSGPVCKITSLPSFVGTGEGTQTGSVADILEVGCEPAHGFQHVSLSATQLYDRCKGQLVWFVGHSPPKASPGATVTGVELDGEGNATVALLAGPECQAGPSQISAQLEATPYERVSATFTVIAPQATKAGVYALPNTEIEDNIDSSIYTIVAVEFPPADAEHSVVLGAQELFARCQIPPHLVWMGSGPTVLGIGLEGIKVKLDDSGNAFALLFGEESCASGPSLIEASLEKAPFTAYTTEFTILTPQPSI